MGFLTWKLSHSQEQTKGFTGIDVGIKEFYSDSNGNVVPNPKYLEKSTRKLIREQRKLSRKQKGSNNRNKLKVALVHEKIANQRNMMRNHKLAQHIGSVSWSRFFDMLAYKSGWYGECQANRDKKWEKDSRLRTTGFTI
ncbi:MAG: transposase [Blautia sp.]